MFSLSASTGVFDALRQLLSTLWRSHNSKHQNQTEGDTEGSRQEDDDSDRPVPKVLHTVSRNTRPPAGGTVVTIPSSVSPSLMPAEEGGTA